MIPSATSRDVLTVLKKIDEEILSVREYWTKGVYKGVCNKNLNTTYCLVGAVKSVIGVTGLYEGSTTQNRLLWESLNALERHVQISAARMNDDAATVLIYYNDKKHRTFADIKALLKRTIKSVEKEMANGEESATGDKSVTCD